MAAPLSPLLLKEDAELLSKVLRVGITGTAGDASARGGDPYVELTDLAAELKSEVAELKLEAEPTARWADVSTRRSLLDRALVGRLSATNTPVVDYLIASYQRCSEQRSRISRPSPAQEELYAYVSELCVSYASIALINPSMFPQPPEVEKEGALRLLRPLREEGREGGLPSAFLSKLVARLVEGEELQELSAPLFAQLQADIGAVSLSRDFAPPYRALMALVREKPLAAALAADAAWLPATVRPGALLEAGTLLGPFLRLSCFPNDSALVSECFGDLTQHHSLESSLSTLRMSLQACICSSTFLSHVLPLPCPCPCPAPPFQPPSSAPPHSLRLLHPCAPRTSLQVLQGNLHAIVAELLKNKDAKEPLFRLVGAACSLNAMRAGQYFCHAEMARMLHVVAPEMVEEPTPSFVSSDGFLINLAAIFLQLCDPLAAPNSPHVSKIDATYPLSKQRMDLDQETRLSATAEDVAYWLAPADAALRQAYEARCAEAGTTPEPPGATPLAVSASFGTISEYFFLTMRLLHVGLLTSFSVLEQMQQRAHRWKSELDMAQAELMRLRQAGSGNPLHAHIEAQLQAQVDKYKQVGDANKRNMLAYRAQVASPALLSSALRYYRLVARWLVQCANPTGADLPLPAEVPKLFSALPEYCMDDIAQFFKQLQHIAPDFLETVATEELNDFLTLMVTFIGEPRYVKNPYLRATFTKMLRFLVPATEENRTSGHGSERLSAVFHTHPLARRHLAPRVMQFFVDIEFTEGAGGSGYEKYEFRHEMAQILEYLWAQPEYHATMLDYARDAPRFVRFVNMLINDSIYAMDEALSKLRDIQDTQKAMADEAAWARLPNRQRQQQQQQLSQNENTARYFMQFTNEVLHMLSYLSAEKDVAVVFMLPELAGRVASMLNYFLGQLVGPKSTGLKVKEPEKFFFVPKRLLCEIATTYTHFAPFEEFAHAVVRDERSYETGNMRKAIRVLSGGSPPNLPSSSLATFEALCRRCVEAQGEMADEEEELGDIPDEFLDEITSEIMTDPVRLPSGNLVDRATISRHLLSNETNPFTRQKLTVDMLQDAPEVKQQIAEYREKCRAEAAAAKAAAKAAEAQAEAGAAPMELN
jgi:ubiquitin conjugation factor E4 B